MMSWAKFSEIHKNDILKRLAVACKEEMDSGLEWLLSADPMGSVRSRARRPYTDTLFHSFSNVNSRPEVLKPGTCHVAVGFLDLGNLATSVMTWDEVRGEVRG